MAMIKKISRKNTISQISAKTIVEHQKIRCGFCGDQVIDKKNADGTVFCSNPTCPLITQKEGL